MPTDFSLGNITIYLKDRPFEPAETLEAKGIVRVPMGARLFLDLGQEVCDQMSRIHLVPRSLLSNGVSIQQKNLDKADFRELRTITDLTCLNISLCPAVKVEQLRQLGTLESLESFSLSGTELDRPDFSWILQFPNLKTLNLFGVGADKSCLGFITDLSLLQELDLGRAQVSDEGIRSLWQRRNLNTLSLAECQVGDAALNEVGHCLSLHALKVPATRISDRGVEIVARELGQGSLQLKLLELRLCQITDKSLVYLSSLTSLDLIGLWNTDVTREGVAGS